VAWNLGAESIGFQPDFNGRTLLNEHPRSHGNGAIGFAARYELPSMTVAFLNT
jgi:hypothetical protein